MRFSPSSAGFRILAALPGHDLDRPSESALADLRPAGVTLFARNLASPAQVRDLVLGLREVLGERILVAIDQEGGRVNRLAALDPRLAALPDGREQAAWPKGRFRAAWEAVGRALASLGINVDFAPVLDLDDGPPVNAIGPRSYGLDPDLVVRCADEVLAGLASAGVQGCLKHFPGLGGTDVDTHHALAVCRCPLRELEQRHLEPFRRLAARAPLVMTSHAHYEAVDPGEPCPGSFSRVLIEDWLRGRLEFSGVIASDDLEMGAARVEPSPGGRAVRAARAGADLLLFCHGLDAPRKARDTLARSLDRGDLDPEAHQASIERLEVLRGAASEAGARMARSGEDAREAVERLVETLADVRDRA